MPKDLMPQPGKKALAPVRSLLPNAGWDAIKKGFNLAGGAAALTGALTWFLHWLESIPLTVKVIGGLFLFSFASLSIAYLIGAVQRRKQKRLADSTPKQEAVAGPQNAADEIEQRDAQIRRLQESNTSLEYTLDLRRQELERYAWLHEIAKAQAEDISRYVTIEAVRIINPHDPTPGINFYFYVSNKSNYHVTIDEVKGAIRFEGRPLTYPLTVLGNEINEFPPLEVGVLTISQPLRPEEVARISEFGDNVGYYFSVDELRIAIRGGANFPQVKPRYLSTKDKVPELPAPNVKELKDRIRQLEAEKAAKAKPDIAGKIKGVYSEPWANKALSAGGGMFFDYHFIVNAFVTNRGAATTIEQFKLVLKVGERSYDGEREKDSRDVKDGEEDWRAWGADELDDLEKSNDVPLEHTRNGALWFVVRGVPGTENKSDMKIELSVVDKDGTSYYLDASPQPQWQDNPFLKRVRMDEARARMREHF